jgi:hypothetical protein
VLCHEAGLPIGVSPALTAVFDHQRRSRGGIARFVLNTVGSKASGSAASRWASPRKASRAGVQGERGSGGFAGLGMGLHGIQGAVLIPQLL